MDDLVTVTERDINEMILLMLEKHKLVIETNFLFFPLLMTEKLLFQQLIHKRNMKFLKMIHQHRILY